MYVRCVETEAAEGQNLSREGHQELEALLQQAVVLSELLIHEELPEIRAPVPPPLPPPRRPKVIDKSPELHPCHKMCPQPPDSRPQNVYTVPGKC